MGRGDSDDGQAMSRTAQCDGHGEYGVTEDLAGDDVHPAAHRHCQEIYLAGSNGSNPSGRDRRKPAIYGHAPAHQCRRSSIVYTQTTAIRASLVVASSFGPHVDDLGRTA